tara:strand:+ start:162 stop:356 length:195 start_codon:yes stop_codon:yes gene_type:complete
MTQSIIERRDQLNDELQTIQNELIQAQRAVDLFSQKEIELQTRINELDALNQSEVLDSELLALE